MENSEYYMNSLFQLKCPKFDLIDLSLTDGVKCELEAMYSLGISQLSDMLEFEILNMKRYNQEIQYNIISRVILFE